MSGRKVPQHLIDQYGEDVFRDGLAAAERRRAEARQSGCLRPDPRHLRPGTQPSPVPGHLPAPTGISETPQTPFPEHVKIWAPIGLAAIHARRGGAWRLWALAHTLDADGSGTVPRADLESYLAHLGKPSRTFRRWLAEARRLGLIRSVRGGAVLLLAARHKGALALGCAHVGPRPARVRARKLASSGWRGYLWGAYLASSHREKMVSRQKLVEITGVPEQTQRDWEAGAGAVYFVNTPNYAFETALSPGAIDGYKEFVRPHAFVFHEQGVQMVAFRIPDTRSVHKAVAESLNRGRSGKMNTALNWLLEGAGESAEGSQAASLTTGRGSSGDPVRLFHKTHKGLKAVRRRLGRSDRRDVDELFERLPDIRRRRGRSTGAPLNRAGRWVVSQL